MKPINIRDKNSDKINAALLAVNGRAYIHTITTALMISDIADAADAYLSELGLTKSRRCGAKVSFTSGGRVASAYKWMRKTTLVHLEYRPSGWFLNAVEEVELWGNAPKPTYTLTHDQDKIVVAKARSAYVIETQSPSTAPHASSTLEDRRRLRRQWKPFKNLNRNAVPTEAGFRFRNY